MKKIFIILSIPTLVAISGAATLNKKNNFFKDPKGFAFVPMGTLETGSRNVSIQAFYISSTEVTNGQYLEFLTDLKKQGNAKEYEIAKIDTSLWMKYDLTGESDYVRTYHLKENFPQISGICNAA